MLKMALRLDENYRIEILIMIGHGDMVCIHEVLQNGSRRKIRRSTVSRIFPNFTQFRRASELQAFRKTICSQLK